MKTLGALALLGAVLGCGNDLQDALDRGDTPDRDADAGADDAGNPGAVEVVNVVYGPGAGFGQDRFPEIVLGLPQGGGESKGGLDVLSLGQGGSITLRLGRDAVDGPGPDLVVYENAFRLGTGPNFFTEPGEVAVSADGVSFTAFPCAAAEPFTGCAGLRPVYSPGADGGISATDPAVSGGDLFDLADLGLAAARYVRITDRSTVPPFPNTAGFDLDAVVVIPHDGKP